MDARAYLLDRFLSDAATLRQRAESLNSSRSAAGGIGSKGDDPTESSKGPAGKGMYPVLDSHSSRRPPRPAAGPDAAMSARMAEACEDVAARIRTIPADASLDVMLNSLTALTLPLEAAAKRYDEQPMIKSVYLGAVARIRDLLAAEARVAAQREGGRTGNPPVPPS